MPEAGGRRASEQDGSVPPNALLATLLPVCRQTGSNSPDRTIRTGGLSSRKRGFWKLPKILGRSLSPGFSGQAIEFLHILRIGIGPALLSERGKKLFG